MVRIYPLRRSAHLVRTQGRFDRIGCKVDREAHLEDVVLGRALKIESQKMRI
jgi:D-hexose-6-phosphate mutarotase